MLRSALPLLALTVACATSPKANLPAPAPAPAPDPREVLRSDVETLRREVPAYLRAQADAVWKSWTEGQLEQATNLGEQAERLFTAEAVGKVSALARETSDASEARALRRLELYLASEVAARSSRATLEKLAETRATATVSFDGMEIPFRDLEGRLAAEAHPGQRRALARSATPVMRTLESAALARDAQVAQALRQLGHDGAGPYAVALRELDPAKLAVLAEQILARTEQPYREALAARAREESRLSVADLRRSDVPRLFRTGLVDSYFTKDRMRPAFESTLAAMGLGLEQLGVRADAEPRPRKSPRALALPVEIPSDVRLSFKPAAGLGPFAQLLHEGGSAVAFASTSAESFELAHLGNATPAQALGTMLEGLTGDPAFSAGLGIPEAKIASHVRTRALAHLYDLRREAARFLCDVAWYAEGADRGQVCRRVIEQAQGFALDESDEGRWVVERGPLFASASRLAALVAAGQLEALLVERVGGRWWADARSGELIRETFAKASSRPVDEWVTGWAGQGLDAAPLLQRLESRLKQR